MRNRTWQSVYLTLLVVSVFMGSSFLALSTPVAKLSLYRVLSLGGVLLIGTQLRQQRHFLMWTPQNVSSGFVAMCWGWWLWAIVSGAWVIDLKLWFQAVFLLTLGVATVSVLYLWTDSWATWQRLVNAMWTAMTGLLLLGYSEIITGKYWFVDLTKSDNAMSTRAPVTIFANQNDYGVLLLTYIIIGTLVSQWTKSWLAKWSILMTQLLAVYLIYRTLSRMSLLCVLLFIVIRVLQSVQWRCTKQLVARGAMMAVMGSIVLAIVKPQFIAKAQAIIFVNLQRYISGDMIRINLMRNGWHFLAKTFGFGVGAGNIEYWMRHDLVFPTRTITNMHNWWFEILVAYGVAIFALYAISYGLLLWRLIQLSKGQRGMMRQVSNIWAAYLIVYVLASVTSANNMLIEWHWVLFGVIVAYVHLQEKNKGVIV